MTDADWDYFARTGPWGPHEVYRAPKGVDPLDQRFMRMQRLRQSGEWSDASEDTGLRNDWARGDFDFDEDRLSVADVERFYRAWTSAGAKWPGRP